MRDLTLTEAFDTSVRPRPGPWWRSEQIPAADTWNICHTKSRCSLDGILLCLYIFLRLSI